MLWRKSNQMDRLFTKEEVEKIIDTPLRTGDMNEDDEIIEDTMYDAFVRANQKVALGKLLDVDISSGSE